MPFDGKEVNKKHLINAVETILAREGFKNLGVNKIAREAGVDKVLIYRYFGGLHQLVSEYSQTLEFWPGLEELLGQDEQALQSFSAEQQFAFFFKSFLRALRRRPMTQMIMVWWDSEPENEFTKQLDDIRMRRALEFFERLEKIPVDKDLTAIVAILYAAISRLIERSQTTGSLGGINLNNDDGWERIEQGFDLLLHGTFSE